MTKRERELVRWADYYREQRDRWMQRTYDLSDRAQRWIAFWALALMASLVGWTATFVVWMVP